MSLQSLKEKCKKIDQLVERTVLSEDDDTFRILDGIIDIEKYYNAKYRIMWILKEPYDESDAPVAIGI